MTYTVSKVIKRIKNSARQYIFIFVQISIGILIMTVFLTINMSIDRDYKELISKVENNLIKLNIYSQQNTGQSDGLPFDNQDLPSPFSLNDYSIIKKNYENKIKIAYIVKEDINLITTINGAPDISTVNMIFVTDEFFELYYPKVNINSFDSSNIVFIGGRALQIMENGKLADGNVSIHREVILPDKLILKSGEELKIVETNVENGFINRQLLLDISSDSLKVSLEDSIIFPAKYLSIFKIKSNTANTFVSFKFNNQSFSSSTGIGILDYLYSKNGNKFDYCFDTLAEEYLRQINGHKIFAIGLSILSAFIMIIIIVGLTGIILVIVNQRIGEFALSIALGATKGKIFIETILESAIVTSSGGLTGVLLSICILKYVVKFKQFNIYINNKLLLFSLIISIFIGVISSILPLIRIKQMAPIEVLRSL